MGPRRRLLGRHPLKKRVLKNTAAEADHFRLRAAVATLARHGEALELHARWRGGVPEK